MVTVRLVDIHPHIVSTDTARYPVAPLDGVRSAWSRERPVTFEQYLRAMDATGIDKAVLVHSPTTYGFDNSYVADSVASLPERFDGVFSVDIRAADAPRAIRQWAGRGLGGLRLFTGGGATPGESGWLDDPRLHAGWEAATERGLPICVQMPARDAPQLARLLSRYPATRVIVDHMLRPPLEAADPLAAARYLFELARHPNLYLKMTGVNTRQMRAGDARPEVFLRRVVDAFGADRIAWGSNFPASDATLAELVDDLRRCLAFLSPDERHEIMAGTALRLYPRLA